MPKRCPPGVICIENCTLLFIVIAILLGYYAYQQNYASRAMQHGQYSNKEKHFIYTAMPGPISAPLVDQMPQHMFDNRDVLRDPYAPPLRDTRVFPKNSSDPRGVPGIPINVATQSFDTSYRQVGILTRKNGGETILPLMGRPLITNRDKWQYYTMSDSNNSIKLPISQNGKSCTNEYGCNNLYNGDSVYIEGYNDAFGVTVYDNNQPNYIPYL